jgi:hypothetical protein
MGHVEHVIDAKDQRESKRKMGKDAAVKDSVQGLLSDNLRTRSTGASTAVVSSGWVLRRGARTRHAHEIRSEP